jgi:hypothetical protein
LHNGINKYKTEKSKQAICVNLLRLIRSDNLPNIWQKNTYRIVLTEAITPIAREEAPSLEARNVKPNMALLVPRSIRKAGRYIMSFLRDIGLYYRYSEKEFGYVEEGKWFLTDFLNRHIF